MMICKLRKPYVPYSFGHHHDFEGAQNDLPATFFEGKPANFLS